RILVKHRWLIVSIVTAAVVLGLVTTLMQTPVYTSTVRIQIDRAGQKIVQGGNVTAEANEDDLFMQTQYELLQSRTLAERVASALKLGDDPSFFRPRTFSIIGFIEKIFKSGSTPVVQQKADLRDAAAGIVLGNRVVRPVVGSRLVDIGYSDP